MNLTAHLLDLMLKASNLSRWQFIQEYSIPPLVAVPRLPSALLPVFGLLYMLIFGFAVVGNGAVLVLLCRRKALQSPSTFFICSLALSDLLISIVCVPATLLQHFFINWLAGRIIFCSCLAEIVVSVVFMMFHNCVYLFGHLIFPSCFFQSQFYKVKALKM